MNDVIATIAFYLAKRRFDRRLADDDVQGMLDAAQSMLASYPYVRGIHDQVKRERK